jgi:hypothetical protein
LAVPASDRAQGPRSSDGAGPAPTLAGRLEVTQGAVSKLEHSDDVRVSTLRQYLAALGAWLELVAVFDDEDQRVPIHLGKDTAA